MHGRKMKKKTEILKPGVACAQRELLQPCVSLQHASGQRQSLPCDSARPALQGGLGAENRWPPTQRAFPRHDPVPSRLTSRPENLKSPMSTRLQQKQHQALGAFQEPDPSGPLQHLAVTLSPGRGAEGNAAPRGHRAGATRADYSTQKAPRPGCTVLRVTWGRPNQSMQKEECQQTRAS